jgi:hypothetical protein
MKILGMTDVSDHRRTFIAEVSKDELIAAFEKGYDSTDFSRLKAGDVVDLAQAVNQRQKVLTATKAMQSAYEAFVKAAPVMTDLALVISSAATKGGSMSTDKYPPLPDPERNPPDPSDIIAGALGTSRAHAYDLMREACAAAQPAAALTDDEIFLAYTAATGKTLPTLGPSRNDLIAISRAVIAAHEAKKGGEA